MADKIEGYLEIGTNDRGEVVLNLDRDRNGVGHIVFSPSQARGLADALNRKANEAEGHVCTGISATWCPIHGDCTCADREDLNDYDCPLHSSSSDHGD